MINMMMAGVAGSRDGANFKWPDGHDVVVFKNSDTLGCDRREFSPEPFHLIAVKTRRRSDQLRRIDQVRRTARVNVNRGAEFREAPGGAGVIEMDVTEKNVANIVRGETRGAHCCGNIVESRRCARVEKRDAVVSLERGRRDNSRAVEVFGVENVNHEM